MAVATVSTSSLRPATPGHSAAQKYLSDKCAFAKSSCERVACAGGGAPKDRCG